MDKMVIESGNKKKYVIFNNVIKGVKTFVSIPVTSFCKD